MPHNKIQIYKKKIYSRGFVYLDHSYVDLMDFQFWCHRTLLKCYIGIIKKYVEEGALHNIKISG